MGTDDKISNKAEELKGRAKENIGDVTDDEQLQAEGRADQTEGALKQAGEKVKDAGKKVKDAFTKDT
ncbi:CsbD family protein [Nonomuraea sp. NPDC005501]|uniref:CsbD family protein n=1 Tax=unclassified Nonomuraea TaxID=2593643 RepID=UPI0033BB45A7